MHEPCPKPFNLAAYVLGAVQSTPDKIALEIASPLGVRRWSYAALAEAVRGIGTGLLEVGLAPGDRLLLRLGNTVDFPLAFLGAVAVGVIPVPTAAGLTRDEITRLAWEIDPRAVLAAPELALPDHPAKVFPASLLGEWSKLPLCSFAMGDPNRLAYLVFTSGTSGRPRAVMHAHRAVWARRMMWRGWYGLCPDDRLMHAGAFNWTYTLGTGLLDPWAMGATALIPAAGTEFAQLPLLIDRFGVTIFAAAPGVYRNILKSPVRPMRSLRHCLSAGEKLPERLRAAWQEATGTPIFEALGMTEISTFISAHPGRPAPKGAIGWPQPGRHVAVLRDDGTEAQADETGELCVRADDPGLFLGYWNAPAETAERIRDGWFHTGDLVARGEDGAIRYVGRLDDLMNAGGFRVAPAEVEDAFADCAGIAEAAATAVEIKPGVSVIALFYRPTAEPLPVQELEAHAKARLARFKQPRLYVPLPELPRGTNGKINRKALVALWQELKGAV